MPDLLGMECARLLETVSDMCAGSMRGEVLMAGYVRFAVMLDLRVWRRTDLNAVGAVIPTEYWRQGHQWPRDTSALLLRCLVQECFRL